MCPGLKRGAGRRAACMRHCTKVANVCDRVVDKMRHADAHNATVMVAWHARPCAAASRAFDEGAVLIQVRARRRLDQSLEYAGIDRRQRASPWWSIAVTGHSSGSPVSLAMQRLHFTCGRLGDRQVWEAHLHEWQEDGRCAVTPRNMFVCSVRASLIARLRSLLSFFTDK